MLLPHTRSRYVTLHPWIEDREGNGPKKGRGTTEEDVGKGDGGGGKVNNRQPELDK